MELDAFRQWTTQLAENLRRDPRVIGLGLLGSAADIGRRTPDTWSDHDFFVITQPGVQEDFRQTLDWLPDAGQIVLRPRETDHGLKVLFADGHMIEFAVFDFEEMRRYARVNDYRVEFEPEDGCISAALREMAAREAAPAPFDRDREIALMLSLLVIGCARVARGEVLSGSRFVKDFALSGFLRLLAHEITPTAGGLPDNLDPFRRVERCYPQIAPQLHAALLLPPLDAAAALLDLAAQTFADLPAAALATVQGEIARAAGSQRVNIDP
ncbi:MAG: hypothetical protein IAE80_00250 [Anaerolinea sp.]|nr:hypothetical protein [Anaerolinea sp.]